MTSPASVAVLMSAVSTVGTWLVAGGLEALPLDPPPATKATPASARIAGNAAAKLPAVAALTAAAAADASAAAPAAPDASAAVAAAPVPSTMTGSVVSCAYWTASCR